MKLPKILNKINPKESYIDATPDGNYALRILKYYRRRCDERWEVSGGSAKSKIIYDLMNQHQKQRAKELDKAIKILEKGI